MTIWCEAIFQTVHHECWKSAFNLITQNEVHYSFFIYFIGWQGWERKGGKEGGRGEKGIIFPLLVS